MPVSGASGRRSRVPFEEAQAEAVVRASGEAMGGNVATREHVAAEISRVTAGLAALEARLYRRLW